MDWKFFDKLLKYVFVHYRTLYKYIVCDLQNVISFYEKIVGPGLECFKECCDIMCSLYSSELPAYLAALSKFIFYLQVLIWYCNITSSRCGFYFRWLKVTLQSRSRSDYALLRGQPPTQVELPIERYYLAIEASRR